jgi:antitoxin (DNA-binding transcriptional repressor) of toxin-antitoxin stability system
MKIAPVAEFKAWFSAYLNRLQIKPVIVTTNGKAAAVLLPINLYAKTHRYFAQYAEGVEELAAAALTRLGRPRHPARLPGMPFQSRPGDLLPRHLLIPPPLAVLAAQSG